MLSLTTSFPQQNKKNNNKNEREYQDKGENCENVIMKSTRKTVCQIIHDASLYVS